MLLEKGTGTIVFCRLNEKFMARPDKLRPAESQQPFSPLTTLGLKPSILQAQKSNLAYQENTRLLRGRFT